MVVPYAINIFKRKLFPVCQWGSLSFGSYTEDYRYSVYHIHNECEFTASPQELKEYSVIGVGVSIVDVFHIVILGWLFLML